jgi:hypothetical protein
MDIKKWFELNISIPKFNKQVKDQFELQEDFVLNATFLLDYNIKPRDLLDLIDKNDLIAFIKIMSGKRETISLIF